MAHWPRSAAELTFEKELGKGCFGRVHACRFKADPSRPWLAVKVVPLDLIQKHNMMEQMDREIKILQGLDHPHIVRLHCDFRDKDNIYLGMEFAEGGGMFNALYQLGKFPLEPSAQYFYETCDALDYLHTLPEKIIHRDIKPENILFDKDRHVKLADFGWSNLMGGLALRSTPCGTPDYLAPEMVRNEGHNESLDMWEMGVLLYEMVVGKSPFGARSADQTYENICKCDLRFPPDIDLDAKDCITHLCKIDPNERLTAKQAKNHAFVARNYRGRPTEIIQVSLADKNKLERPSVETSRLRRDKNVLEGEMKILLTAKSQLEQQLLELSQELEGVCGQLRQERDRADKEKMRADSAEDQLRKVQGRQGRRSLGGAYR